MSEPEETDRLIGRNGRIWRDYCAGRTQEALAQEHGISQARVCQIIKQVRDSIPVEDREEEVQRSLEMLRELRAGAIEIYRAAPAPVFVGKDGDVAYDPETQAVVRDHSGRVQALLAAVKVEARIGQILGYDAATKLDHTVSGMELQASEALAAEAAARVRGASQGEALEGEE